MRLGCWGKAVPVSLDQALLLMRGFTLVSSVLQEKLWSWFVAVAESEWSVTCPLSLGAPAVWDWSSTAFPILFNFSIVFHKGFARVWFSAGRYPHGEHRGNSSEAKPEAWSETAQWRWKFGCRNKSHLVSVVTAWLSTGLWGVIKSIAMCRGIFALSHAASCYSPLTHGLHRDI